MCGLDFDPRTNIRRDEGIVKNSDILKGLPPIAILKYRLTIGVIYNDMWRMLRAKPLALRNIDRIIGGK
jgi:hypothetical protein